MEKLNKIKQNKTLWKRVKRKKKLNGFQVEIVSKCTSNLQTHQMHTPNECEIVFECFTNYEDTCDCLCYLFVSRWNKCWRTDIQNRFDSKPRMHNGDSHQHWIYGSWCSIRSWKRFLFFFSFSQRIHFRSVSIKTVKITKTILLTQGNEIDKTRKLLCEFSRIVFFLSFVFFFCVDYCVDECIFICHSLVFHKKKNLDLK